MTLDELFRIAEVNEPWAIALLRTHPDLAGAIEVAGGYQEGRAAPAIVHPALRGLSELVTAFLDAGADIESRGLGGGTALHVAARIGVRETVQVLVNHGAPVDRRCVAFGAMPLGWAAHGFGPDGCFPKRDHVGAAEALLWAGADPELQNGSGNRPIDLVQPPVDHPLRWLPERHGSRAGGRTSR